MIGDKVRQRRQELGLTQEELAHKMGYRSKSTVNKIEKNVHDVSQSNLLKLASVLDCSPAYFIDIEVKHDMHYSAHLIEYAKRLSELPPDQLDNVMHYIDFLKERGGTQ
jgi:transcriptional regulator with XRE-family HTH domain